MNGVLANRELVQSVQKTMDPHAARSETTASTTVDGTAARPAGQVIAQSKGGLGSRG